MDSKKIKELLERYWNCETSLEEEAQLREYFQGTNIPDELKEAATLFQYFHESKNQPTPEVAFDPSKRAPKGEVKSLISYSLRIAAGIAVLVVATWFIRNEINKQRIAEEEISVEDEEVKRAFEETKKALMMISANFGKAEQEARKINLFNQAQEEIQKPDQR